MYETIFIFGAFTFLYGILSGKFEKVPFNGALVYILFGLLIGPIGLGWFHVPINAEILSMLAELTLTLVLFTDAASANLGTLKTNYRIPARMLLIGLPLTILLGFGVGLAMFGSLTLLEVAILSTILAPTDAALGKAVVTDARVPSRFREGLNIESGLNDGICVPILFLFLMKIGAGAEPEESMLLLFAKEIGIGALVGVGITLLGAYLIKRCNQKAWIIETWKGLLVITLALVCFSVAQLLGGSGFIAAFVGGLVFGHVMRDHKHELLIATENRGNLLGLVTWVIFGAVVIPYFIGHISIKSYLYALLSLTVIRMGPIYLSLSGLGLQPLEKVFLAWFGPRGLASIVFLVIVAQADLPGGSIIASTVIAAITLSIITHGLSAQPFVSALAKRTTPQGTIR